MKKIYLLLIFIIFSCEKTSQEPLDLQLREEVMIQNAVFRISYNEFKEYDCEIIDC